MCGLRYEPLEQAFALSSGLSNGVKYHGLVSLGYHSTGNTERSLHVWHDVLLSRYVNHCSPSAWGTSRSRGDMPLTKRWLDCSSYIMEYRFDRHSIGIHAEISWIELHQCLWSICSRFYRRSIPKQSVFQYLEKRFDRSVRMCASFAFSFFMVNDLVPRANLL